MSVQAYVLSPDNPGFRFHFMPAGIGFIAMFTGTEMWRPSLRQVQILALHICNSRRLSTFHIFIKFKVSGLTFKTPLPGPSHTSQAAFPTSPIFPNPLSQCGLRIGSCNPPCVNITHLHLKGESVPVLQQTYLTNTDSIH